MHLGHLKAYWADHTLPNDSTEAQELDDVRQKILNGHLTLLNYAIQFGYSFDKWKCIVNTMLEKDKGIPKIHQLRVLHLYEADYNLLLGMKWRQVLHHAAAQGLLNDGCYGSQPGKEATDALIIRELEYEISRLTRKSSLHLTMMRHHAMIAPHASLPTWPVGNTECTKKSVWFKGRPSKKLDIT